MSEENKHMDDSFKKMSEDLNASYDKSFWQDAQANLENDALDEAFRNAADQSGSTAGMALASASLGDAFMDDAFQDAAAEVSATYSSAHWAALQAAMPDLQMDDAFADASKEIKASYNPVYWGAANSALEKEGLHYEYNATYWNEAKTLLDNADRKSFFTKWTGVAALLLLISMLGIYGSSIGDDAISGQRMSNGLNDLNENRLANLNAGDDNTALVQLVNDQSNDADLVNVGNGNNSDVNNAELEFNLVADNNPELNNDQNNNPTIADDLDNEGPDSNDPNNVTDQNVTQETINPFSIRPNSLVNINDGTNNNNPEADLRDENNYNPLDREMQNNIANQNIGLNYGNQAPETMQPETNDVSETSNRFIDRMALPSSLIEFETMEVPNSLLATIESPKMRNVHTFSLLAGVGKGIGYGSSSSIWTNRYYGGLAYNTYGHGKLRKFDFGVNVLLNCSEHEDLRRRWTRQEHKYNTEVETNYLEYNVSQLYNLNINLNTSYEFIPKHKLRVGLGISRAFAAKSNVVTNFTGSEDENNFISLGSASKISNGNNELPEDFEVFDLSLSLGYEFEINRRLSIQISGTYGFLDRTNDDIFRGRKYTTDHPTVFDNERSVTIGLKYNLFRVVK
ncbi:MAG: hypothetical protein ACI8ZM_000239 [Crocinitomix sp.]|jgi:hypothetical protein